MKAPSRNRPVGGRKRNASEGGDGMPKTILLALIATWAMATAASAQSAPGVTRWASGVAGNAYPTSAKVQSHPGSDADSKAHEHKDVTGSWICDVNPDGGDKFKALLTFTRDGGLIESEDFPFQSSGHGTWTRVGDHKFAFTFLQLVSSDVDGTFAGTYKIRSSSESLEGDKLIEPGATVEFLDPDNNIIFSGTAAASCTRILVEP